LYFFNFLAFRSKS